MTKSNLVVVTFLFLALIFSAIGQIRTQSEIAILEKQTYQLAESLYLGNIFVGDEFIPLQPQVADHCLLEFKKDREVLEILGGGQYTVAHATWYKKCGESNWEPTDTFTLRKLDRTIKVYK